MQAAKSIPKSINSHWMPSFLYSSCSRTNMWWLKNCCSFSLVKLMHSCSKLLNCWFIEGCYDLRDFKKLKIIRPDTTDNSHQRSQIQRYPTLQWSMTLTALCPASHWSGWPSTRTFSHRQICTEHWQHCSPKNRDVERMLASVCVLNAWLLFL